MTATRRSSLTIPPIHLRYPLAAPGRTRRPRRPAAVRGRGYRESPNGRPRRPMLPFAPMSTTSEVPAEFRHAAARPGPFHLLGEAIQEVLSRRRLVVYLVRADIRKKGADTFL